MAIVPVLFAICEWVLAVQSSVGVLHLVSRLCMHCCLWNKTHLTEKKKAFNDKCKEILHKEKCTVRLQIRLEENLQDFTSFRTFLPKTSREKIAIKYCFGAHTYECKVIYLKQAVALLAGTHFRNVDPKIASSPFPHPNGETEAHGTTGQDHVQQRDAMMPGLSSSVVNAPVPTSLGLPSFVRREASNQIETRFIGQHSFLRRKATWSQSTAQIVGTMFGSDRKASDDPEIEDLDSRDAVVLVSAGSMARKGFKALPPSSPEAEVWDDAPSPSLPINRLTQLAANTPAAMQAHEEWAGSVEVPNEDDELGEQEESGDEPMLNAWIDVDVLILMNTEKVNFVVDIVVVTETRLLNAHVHSSQAAQRALKRLTTSNIVRPPILQDRA